MPDKISYKTHIQPILAQNCLSCHNTANYKDLTDGTLNMDNFNELYAYTLSANGRNGVSFLIGNIRHDAGFQPMPKNASKLSDCEIATIKAWVDAGAPNN